MDPLTAFRGNAQGNLSATTKQRVEAFKQLTAQYRTQAQAANGQGAAFKAVLSALQARGVKLAPGYAKSVVTDNSGDSGNRDTTASGQLGKDTYLQLLVTQMSNQDPLSPMDNTAMVAQLAQFSALEQMQNLNEKFDEFSGNVDQLNYISANNLIGKYVTGVDANKQPVKGTVQQVGLDGSVVVLNVDGKVLPMSGVLSIGTPPAAASSKAVRTPAPSGGGQ